MGTLADALIIGEGIERPFRCEEHDDHSASASVNILKGVWCCYACGAAGAVDAKKSPSTEAIEIMLNPDKHCRTYPEAYLELFANDLGNFAERFPPWLRWHAKLGCDPLTGDATFPVYTHRVQLAGVGRRKEHPKEGESRYAYPPRWSASRSVFVAGKPADVLVLVEGAADASAVAQTGAFAFGLYGSGLHKPQIDLIMRLSPRLVVIALDADEAGYRATHGGFTKSGNYVKGVEELLDKLVNMTVVDWAQAGQKDPADTPLEHRRQLLAESVIGAGYRPDIEAVWTTRAVELQARYALSVEA